MNCECAPCMGEDCKNRKPDNSRCYCECHAGQVNVDWEWVEKLLGGKIADGLKSDPFVQFAARAITDSSYNDSSPTGRLGNAKHWVKKAYDDGYSLGSSVQRKRMAKKIVVALGIEGDL